MDVAPLTPKKLQYLKDHNLAKKFNKQLTFLKVNLRHPSLHTELLEPRERNIRSFRIDRSYRALFIYNPEEDLIEILVITRHYQ